MLKHSSTRLQQLLKPVALFSLTLLFFYSPKIHSQCNLDNDAGVALFTGVNTPLCDTTFTPKARMRNLGSVDLTTVTILYSVDGELSLVLTGPVHLGLANGKMYQFPD